MRALTKHQRFTATCPNWISLGVAGVLLVVFNASLAIASSGTLYVTSKTTLTEDHYGNVVVQGNNITLDCANHAVAGPGVSGINGGIEVDFDTGIIVKRCKVTGFDVNGIRTNTTPNSQYEDNTITDNGAHGIAIAGGIGNQVTRNTIRSNGAPGLSSQNRRKTSLSRIRLEITKPLKGEL